MKKRYWVIKELILSGCGENGAIKIVASSGHFDSTGKLNLGKENQSLEFLTNILVGQKAVFIS